MSHPAAPAMPPRSTPAQPPPGLDTQELRIAPVLVGGVSLAIWMGGMMYELERLTRAGRSRDHGAYRALLEVMDVDVTVDVLSGTSAGGINAAAFALARRRGGSVAGLRDLWLRVGSFSDLLRNPYEKAPPSLMRGDEVMLTELFKAFTEMPCVADPMPDPLNLFLTGTYLRGELSQYRDDYGTLISDVNHAALFRFNEDQLRPADRERALPPDPSGDTGAAALALAARTSASFPYAFEPSFLPVAPDAKPAARDPMHPLMGEYTDGTANHLAVDGGALSNRPLGPALEAIFEQTADREVRRVLAYITPTTAGTVVQPAEPKAPRLGKVMAETVGAMLNQSISNDLARLRKHNERVGSVHNSRLQLAKLALLGTGIGSDDAWHEYVCQRAEREASALLEQVTRQIRGLSVQGRAPAAWSDGVEKIQATPRQWIETLETQRQDALGNAVRNAMAAKPSPPVELGLDLFEACHAAALPVFRVVLGLLRTQANWTAIESLHTHRAALRTARESARPTNVSVYAAVRQVLTAALAGGQSKPVTDLLSEVATAWPPPNAERALHNAWRELAAMVRTLADRLDDALPQDASANELRPDESRAITEARPILTYLTRGIAANVQADGLVAWRLADLVVAQEALCGRDVIDQRVELIQMSADTRTQLLAGPDGQYSRASAGEKLTGLQLHHFGAFYKAAWRANDWMWGRLDGAGWLVHVLLDPKRIRQRYPTPSAFLEALGSRGLLSGPFVPQAMPADVRKEVDDVFGAQPPTSLPNLALFIAAALQAQIAAEEVPVLAAQIDQDRRDGFVESRDGAFLRAAGDLARVGAGPPDARLLAAQAALRVCSVGDEKLKQDAGSPRFVTTVSTTAAMVTATLDSAVEKPPGPVARLLKSLRSVALTVFIMAKGLKRAGPIGLVAGAAIAVAGAADGWAQTTAICVSAGLLLLLLTIGLRYGENRVWPDVGLIVVVVAALVFTALAGLWPEPVKNWPWDGVAAALRWLEPRWWATAIVVVAALAWLLLPVLRAQITRKKRKQRQRKAQHLQGNPPPPAAAPAPPPMTGAPMHAAPGPPAQVPPGAPR